MKKRRGGPFLYDGQAHSLRPIFIISSGPDLDFSHS